MFNTDRIDYLHYSDLTDSTNLIRILQRVQPDDVGQALRVLDYVQLS